jgi:hypothetical protein
LVSFTLYDDVFIPSDDPCGRNGPKLDQLLNKLVLKEASNGNNQMPIITNSMPSKNTNALRSTKPIKLNNEHNNNPHTIIDNNNDEDTDNDEFSNDDIENLDEFVYSRFDLLSNGINIRIF